MEGSELQKWQKQRVWEEPGPGEERKEQQREEQRGKALSEIRGALKTECCF